MMWGDVLASDGGIINHKVDFTTRAQSSATGEFLKSVSCISHQRDIATHPQMLFTKLPIDRMFFRPIFGRRRLVTPTGWIVPRRKGRMRATKTRSSLLSVLMLPCLRIADDIVNGEAKCAAVGRAITDPFIILKFRVALIIFRIRFCFFC